MVVDAMKPHVVVLPSPGMGHVTPMLELAKRLVLHHNCHVTFLHISTQASVNEIRMLHSSFNHLPPGLNVVDLPPADVSAIISDDTSVFSHLCIIVRESLRCLKDTLLDMQNPQAFITDLFSTQTLDICRDLSIHSYILCTTSALFLAFSFFDCRETQRDVSVEFLHLPGCAPLRTEDVPPLLNNGDNEWFSYHICRLPMADGIFINTWEDLEPVPIRAIREHPFYKQIHTPLVYSIGPLVKETEPVTQTGEECLAWLDKQPAESVLFVALGSGGHLCAEQLTELAWGLELSRKRFLWMVRTPTKVNTGMKSFFDVGVDVNDPKSYLPKGFMERTKELGMVVPSWVPQMLVLRHHSTGAFLSHCGWNSVLESVSHGVPMITWPLYADQMLNATMIAEDIGVAIKPAVEAGRRVIGRKEIERVVRAVMEGEEGKAMRGRANDLKESALKAINFGGTSFEALADVANQWKVLI
ncbi:anthocyanidin 3-O-glucosyltransferase 5-like [Gastrolobium bilobum]|uniref:anthocyanidin 3-O-glucosyltransferase 5-like n=1 Tax=Gastrolobium bilobum TaxID=150636 RepID=UPI002AB02FE2|nr:anthocyanidin 3-O-glucosyltransferase 5-like [Gastrolobium bilobum]